MNGSWLTCALFALIARLGMAVWSIGLVRAKNAAGTTLRHVVDVCIAILGFWAVGGAICGLLLPGPFRLFGFDWHFLLGLTPAAYDAFPSAHIFFLLAVVTLASGILPGVLAERARFGASAWGSAVLALIAVPCMMRWGRFLENTWGFHDFAGAASLHLCGGVFAAVGAMVVGGRTGKQNRDGSSNAIPGHSVPLASIGIFLIAIGWVGAVIGWEMVRARLYPDTATALNAISGPAVAINVLVAAAAGGIGGLIFSHLRYGKPDVYLTCAGLLGALVAITAGADILPGWGALLVGFIAGVAVPYLTIALDLRLKVDDPSGGVAVHVGGAIIGLLAVPIATPAFYRGARMGILPGQLIAIVSVSAFAALLSFAFFKMLSAMRMLRSREADEFDGLDLAEHDIASYPDFQQTTIKSYHLRET